MGSLEAMTKGSDQRYLGDKTKLKIAQGVVGAVADKGSVLKLIPYTMHAVKQGFQDLGASSLQSAHDLLRSNILRLEVNETVCFNSTSGKPCRNSDFAELIVNVVLSFVCFDVVTGSNRCSTGRGRSSRAGFLRKEIVLSFCQRICLSFSYISVLVNFLIYF